MLISGIKSKPTYRELAPDGSGHRHLLIAQGQGGEGISRLHAALQAFGEESANIEIYYASESILNADRTEMVRAAGATADAGTHIFASCAALTEALRIVLNTSEMGMRMYICGTERFIWTVTNLGLEFGIRDDEIQQEHADSEARQIACVHCQGLTYPVRTNIVRCAACGRHLLVRDHFSRRVNAYMGVQIDAEAPGEIPAIVEVYAP
ncbi:dimethylamine monooxygenase subunit DmmA family protein [Glaciimonas sp. PCH181]|uniref:dimethylamine monooxygenase subunit DmmA family protein n=1 Tax=Glaciimonas sp. PCH181 TaxID=2133943 RepID=UPI000D3B517A|nr:dimethylamine monooxygenase subunit DmmA family protein [Glaciimonas sp. PCH181]PUA17752.1 hypothetical protein C7W93_17975 [Glaciimonas sp. PCH181]